jgi:hypothetical protein
LLFLSDQFFGFSFGFSEFFGLFYFFGFFSFFCQGLAFLFFFGQAFFLALDGNVRIGYGFGLGRRCWR